MSSQKDVDATTVPQAGRSAAAGAPGIGVARRSVIKGAAWAAPVIAFSVASPAAAASPDLQVFWTKVGEPTRVGRVFPESTVVVRDETGTPAPDGTPVTFSISGGILWADGTRTPKVVGTVAGRAVMPYLIASSVGTHPVTAMVGTSVQVGSFTVTPLAARNIINIDAGGASAPVSASPVGIEEMSVGMNWLTLRTDTRRWYAYGYLADVYRPIWYGGSPLTIDAGIRTEQSNMFHASSGGRIYSASIGTDYTSSDPVTATVRNAPTGGFVSWAANRGTIYAASTNGRWYQNTSLTGVSWTEISNGYVAAGARAIQKVYSIEGSIGYSWAIDSVGGVFWNQATTPNRSNSLSPMRDLSVGLSVVYGVGTDGRWYAKWYSSTTAAWTRVQYNGADVVLGDGDYLVHGEGVDFCVLVRSDGTMLRTSAGGTAATQPAYRLPNPPSPPAHVAAGTSSLVLMAGRNGRMYECYNDQWLEVQAGGRSLDVYQVGYRDDGARYRWAIGGLA